MRWSRSTGSTPTCSAWSGTTCANPSHWCSPTSRCSPRSWEAPDQERLQRVDKALGAARRLSTLLDDILAMANVESGTIATRPLTVSLRDVVVEALTDVHGGSTVQVTAEGDPRGHADPFHLRQIVTNLVSNALRYGAPPVEVVISAIDGEGVVTVHDHGSGVPAEVVPDMFERFRGAGAAATLGRHGSGFGLYIVGRLAEANGCRVGYTAREPQGSTFWLSVPEPDLGVPCERVPHDRGMVEGELVSRRGDPRPAATGRRRRPTRPAARRARRAGPRGRR